MGTITGIDNKKFLQHLRSNVLETKALAEEALEAVALKLDGAQGTDGMIVLARYYTSVSHTETKSIIGVYASATKSMSIFSDDNAEFKELLAKIEVNKQAINKEIDDRTQADANLDGKITAEKERAEGVEQGLKTDLTAETTAREQADTTLETKITTEAAKAKTEVKEGTDSTHLEIVGSTTPEGGDGHTIYTITVKDVASKTDFDSEVTRSTDLDNAIIAGVGLTSEGNHNQQSGTNYISAASSISEETKALDTAIKAEETRAKGVESENNQAIEREVTRAKGIEDGLRADLGEKSAIASTETAFGRIKKIEEALGADGSVSSQIDAKIQALDVDDTAEINNYVSSVSETDGKIKVGRNVLVHPTEKVLTWTSEGIKSTISIVKGKDESDTTVKELYKLVDRDGNTLGAPIKIYKDSALVSIAIKKACPGTSTGSEPTCDKGVQKDCLCYTYVNVNGETVYANVDISSMLTESEFSNGLQVVEGVVSVKHNKATDGGKFLTVDESGIGLTGITTAIDTAKNEAKSEIEIKGMGHVQVSAKQDEVDGHTIYTITENDIASETNLTTEVAARKAVTGVNGDEYTPYSTDTIISGATSMHNADKLLSNEIVTANGKIKGNTDAIAIINGNAETDGSIIKAINDLRTEIKGTPVSEEYNTLAKLEAKIKAEADRATKKEGEIDALIGTKGTASDTSVFGAIKAEIERATAAEQANNDLITAETASRKTVTGIDGDECTYVDTNYLNAQTSLHAADIVLDAKVKANADEISSLKSSTLSGLTAGNGIEISGDTDTAKTISAKLDSKTSNVLENSASGLYLSNIWDCGTFNYSPEGVVTENVVNAEKYKKLRK